MSAAPRIGGTSRDSLRDRYLAAPDFSAMLAAAQKNVELWAAMWRHAKVDDGFVRRAAALPGAWHLLVLSEDWCGDAVNTVPVVAKLAERAPNTDLRVLGRDDNPDLIDAHLTGSSRSIPVVIALPRMSGARRGGTECGAAPSSYREGRVTFPVPPYRSVSLTARATRSRGSHPRWRATR